jgi:hypothetical protein
LRHPASYFFFGIGFSALVFAVARTYYLIGRMNRKRKDEDTRFSSPDEAGGDQETQP